MERIRKTGVNFEEPCRSAAREYMLGVPSISEICGKETNSTPLHRTSSIERTIFDVSSKDSQTSFRAERQIRLGKDAIAAFSSCFEF